MNQKSKRIGIIISSLLIILYIALICNNHFSDKFEVEITNMTKKSITVIIIESEQTINEFSLEPFQKKIIPNLTGSHNIYYVKIIDECKKQLCFLEINSDIYKSLRRDLFTKKKYPFPIIVRYNLNH